MRPIVDVQTRLMALGYSLPLYGASGTPNEETTEAIAAFQASKGLPATGKLTPPTIYTMFGTGDIEAMFPAD